MVEGACRGYLAAIHSASEESEALAKVAQRGLCEKYLLSDRTDVARLLARDGRAMAQRLLGNLMFAKPQTWY